MNKTLDDELNNVRARIKVVNEKADRAKKQLIDNIFQGYHPELMSYKPYEECVSLAITYLDLKIKESNLIKEIEKGKIND